MKKKIIFIILIIVIILAVVGVLVWQEQREKFGGPVITEGIGTVDANVLDVEKGETFGMAFTANPSTGYQWKAEFDSNYLELLKQEFSSVGSDIVFEGEQTLEAEEIVGAAGMESFEFRALEVGETEIVFSYFRSWEGGVEPIEEHIYKIIIK